MVRLNDHQQALLRACPTSDAGEELAMRRGCVSGTGVTRSYSRRRTLGMEERITGGSITKPPIVGVL